jgi:hypothetical protein
MELGPAHLGSTSRRAARSRAPYDEAEADREELDDGEAAGQPTVRGHRRRIDQQRWCRVKRLLFVAVLLLSTAWPAVPGAWASPAQSVSSAQKTVWYFYRVTWGFQDEFVRLFAKNHLPVLREEIKTGRLVGVRTFVPTYHGDGRADWTFAVVITYKSADAMVGPSGEEAIQRRLYKDWATFQKEEQRRFEILDAHWDVPLNELDLK